MIDVRSHTSRSTRLRKVKKIKETASEELSNGLNFSNGELSNISESSTHDKSWNVMNRIDYEDFRSNDGSVTETSLIDSLFGRSLFGFSWDTLEDVQKRRSGTSSIENSVQDHSSYTDETGTPGFIFRYYKKFGYYWNVFPKTDYCYLPGSPDYNKEVSPGIPKVPNLSRYPLSSFIKRGVGAIDTNRLTTSHLSDSRVSFSENSFKSSTRLESTNNSNQSYQSNHSWSNIESRQNHINSRLRELEKRSKWMTVKRVSQTFLSVIKTTVLMTFTSVMYVGSSLVSSREGSRLSLLLFLIFLLPFLYYFVPDYVDVTQGEVATTAVAGQADMFVTWLSDCFFSLFNLVKESLLYIPTIYLQLAALLSTGNASSPHLERETVCPELPKQVIPSPFPVVNYSKDLTEEKLIAIQTEIVEKLKKEMAGQNQEIASRINKLQLQMGQLTDDLKKVNFQFEGDWKTRFDKVEEELTGLKKDIVSVKDNAVGSIATPSERMVERVVAKYHADRTGKPDYALQSSGGYIVRVRCAQTYTRKTGQFILFGIPLPWDVFNGPETILKPGVMPGECWAFEGSFAQVTLHLATKVRVTGFSLEHSPVELSLHGHISSAPKQFSVWALETENDDDPVFLGRFNFLNNGQSLQQFDAIENDLIVDLIELKIESNQGHPEYTCLYRFRVHGVPPSV